MQADHMEAKRTPPEKCIMQAWFDFNGSPIFGGREGLVIEDVGGAARHLQTRPRAGAATGVNAA